MANTQYIVDGTIQHGNMETLFGDPENGIVVYLPEGILTDEEIARMVKDGYLRLPGELANDAFAAHLRQVTQELAEAQAKLAAKGE